MQRFVNKILICFMMLNLTSEALADSNSQGIGTKTFLEKARSSIVIDGVTVNYGAGAQALTYSNCFSSICYDVFGGFGYHPQYTVSYLNSDFSGPVFASAFGTELSTELFKRVNTSYGLIFGLSETSFWSDELTGRVRGVQTTTDSQGSMTSLKIGLMLKHQLNSKSSFDINIGINSWKLDATGVTYIDNLKVTKKANGRNDDPYGYFSYNSNLFGLDASVAYGISMLRAENTVFVDQITLALQKHF